MWTCERELDLERHSIEPAHANVFGKDHVSHAAFCRQTRAGFVSARKGFNTFP